LENAQCTAFGRQVIEALIFQSEFEKNVARREPNKENKEAQAWSKDARGQKHRHKVETARGAGEEDKQGPYPPEQEHLKPRISILVIQQDVNRSRESDQVAERAVLVGEDKHVVRHKSWGLSKGSKQEEGFLNSALTILTAIFIITVTIW
jgi:hypothetical protein